MLESVRVELLLFNVVIGGKTEGPTQQFLPKHHAIASGKLHCSLCAPTGTDPKLGRLGGAQSGLLGSNH